MNRDIYCERQRVSFTSDIYNVCLSSLFSNGILTANDVACSRVVTDLPEWQLTVESSSLSVNTLRLH